MLAPPSLLAEESGKELSEVDTLPAEVAGGDLGAAGEPSASIAMLGVASLIAGQRPCSAQATDTS
jgi:hypothetical protein